MMLTLFHAFVSVNLDNSLRDVVPSRISRDRTFIVGPESQDISSKNRLHKWRGITFSLIQSLLRESWKYFFYQIRGNYVTGNSNVNVC
jgi:hypothetical protein